MPGSVVPLAMFRFVYRLGLVIHLKRKSYDLNLIFNSSFKKCIPRNFDGCSLLRRIFPDTWKVQQMQPWSKCDILMPSWIFSCFSSTVRGRELFILQRRNIMVVYLLSMSFNIFKYKDKYKSKIPNKKTKTKWKDKDKLKIDKIKRQRQTKNR